MNVLECRLHMYSVRKQHYSRRDNLLFYKSKSLILVRYWILKIGLSKSVILHGPSKYFSIINKMYNIKKYNFRVSIMEVGVLTCSVPF